MFLLVAFIVVGMFPVVVTLLLASRLYLISWESISHHHISYLKQWDSDTNPSDRSLIRNFWSLFCSKYKEPSIKTNKAVIYIAVSHNCLAGKVNEAQRNSTLAELNKCESNHFIILFRGAGCQYRALYSYDPDTEEICKVTGTGPKSITKKMVDKVYKYNSDRKEFTAIFAKTASICIDALTIHKDLWQAKRPALPKKNSLLK